MKRIITVFAMVLFITLNGYTVKAATETTVEPSGDRSGLTDYFAIRDAIKEYDTINLVDGGKYYIGGKVKKSVKGAINVDNNTTINAKGATVTQLNTGKGIFKTTSDAYNKNGYSALKNVKINGGTWIGSTKKCDGYSLFKFFHGQNITIENATFKDNYNGHLLEFAGCKDVVVRNCYFGGTYKGESTNEAVQFDNCSKGCLTLDSEMQYDNTTCKNILFEKNTVIFPRTVGSHNTYGKGKGKFMTNIKIINNKLTATRDMGILLFNWYDSLIEGNEIKGTSKGVDVVSFFSGAERHYAGGLAAAKKNNSRPYNITVKNNKITTAYGYGVRVKGAGVRPISGVTVENNTIETRAKSNIANVVCVEYATKKKGKGVVVRNNTLKSCKVQYPIAVSNSSYVTLQNMKYTVNSSVTRNVVQIRGGASNTVKNMVIQCNKKNKENGIYVVTSNAVKIQGNRITGAKLYGIRLNNAKKPSIKNNKISKSGKKSILKK